MPGPTPFRPCVVSTIIEVITRVMPSGQDAVATDALPWWV